MARFYTTGQRADLMLSGVGFNKSGGPLLFNHPGNVATDGEHLLLADRNNNRVLVWNSLPRGNTAPDLVLGQRSFRTNKPGTTLVRLNWPVGVTAAAGIVVVADTFNDRLLVWRQFPERSGQAADFAIDLPALADSGPGQRLAWPWAVWTDGKTLIATATAGAKVLIWKTFPRDAGDRPDILLTGQEKGRARFGTPRSISTDGRTFLVVGDHNADASSPQGNFFWKAFPQSDQSYAYFAENPFGTELMWGGVDADDGRLVMLAAPGLAIWNRFPTRKRKPNLLVGKELSEGPCDENGYAINDGDGSGIALAPSGVLYVSLYNGNRIVGYDQIPTDATQCPDFAIGAPDIDTNTLWTSGIMTNPLPATDGRSLWVTSDFDSKLSVFRSIPTRSGTPADSTTWLEIAPWDNALYGDTLVIGGHAGEHPAIAIWRGLPRDGRDPDEVLRDTIGSVRLRRVRGVALDAVYFYLADSDEGAIHVWSGLPDSDTDPVAQIALPQVQRLSSDGTYLVAVDTFEHRVQVARVADIAGGSVALAPVPPAGAGYAFNLPNGALVADGRLFVADTGNNRVLAWRSIEDALSGRDPDAVLGKRNLVSTGAAIGKRSLFSPAGLASAGDRLWVGEFKFSHRLVGFR